MKSYLRAAVVRLAFHRVINRLVICCLSHGKDPIEVPCDTASLLLYYFKVVVLRLDLSGKSRELIWVFLLHGRLQNHTLS